MGNYSDLIVVGVVRRKQGRGKDDGFENIDLKKIKLRVSVHSKFCL